MAKKIVPLTDIKIKAIKPQTVAKKMFDGGGLFLLVTPSGGKLWHLKYRFGGIEKLLTLGAYPQALQRHAKNAMKQNCYLPREWIPAHCNYQIN